MPYEYKPKSGPKFDDPEQSRRFIDLAREFRADERKDALERAFAKVVLRRRKVRRTKA